MSKRAKAGRRASFHRHLRDACEVVPAGPFIPRSAVRLLWHLDYYDGPMSGMLRYRDEELWFSTVTEARDFRSPWFRRYAIVRLTPEELAEVRSQHELFRRCVGTHTDYDENGTREVGALRPREMWEEFYDQAKGRPHRAYDRNECVGWFQR